MEQKLGRLREARRTNHTQPEVTRARNYFYRFFKGTPKFTETALPNACEANVLIPNHMGLVLLML